MEMFNLKTLHDLVKKVVDEKLIEEYTYAFIESGDTRTHFHFLSYDEMIEVCEILDKYTDICNIRTYEDGDTLYFFTSCVYDRLDFLAITGMDTTLEDYDYSDYSFEVNNDANNEKETHSLFLTKEFWEFCSNYRNRNKNESEENMNNEITKTEEAFSIQDIYKIVTDSEGFGKIIEGMEDIGFTDETIYEVILNLVKRLD